VTYGNSALVLWISWIKPLLVRKELRRPDGRPSWRHRRRIIIITISRSILIFSKRANIKLGMSKLAIRPELAKPCQVCWTRHFPDVTKPALGSMFTESSCIVRTLIPLLIQVDMSIHALRVGALPKFGKEVAFWHTRHIKLMQVLTILSLFTQTPEPMFTNNQTVIACVSVLTQPAFFTGAAAWRKVE